MKISVITVSYNAVDTIVDTLNSVALQTHDAIEHIVVDGDSTDGTIDRVLANSSRIASIVSEKDDGLYDAMNKGIGLATGDVIGILNSDDYYVDNQVLAKIAQVFATQPIDALFADLVFVKPNELNKIVRYYSGAGFSLSKFAYGCMPPHPTFFVRRECYQKYGLFKTNYQIAADFELMARFMVKHKINYHYLPEVIIKMRTGGISTRSFKNNVILNHEILMACAENGIKTNMLKVYSKYLSKSMQLFLRPT